MEKSQKEYRRRMARVFFFDLNSCSRVRNKGGTLFEDGPRVVAEETTAFGYEDVTYIRSRNVTGLAFSSPLVVDIRASALSLVDLSLVSLPTRT